MLFRNIQRNSFSKVTLEYNYTYKFLGLFALRNLNYFITYFIFFNSLINTITSLFVKIYGRGKRAYKIYLHLLSPKYLIQKSLISKIMSILSIYIKYAFPLFINLLRF